MRPMFLVTSLAFGIGLAGTGVLGSGAAQAEDITVFAAASLKTALDKAAADWQADGGDRVTVSYAGSPQLARQIEQGAPADIFLSASPEWMDTLENADLIDPDSRRDLLGNSLVLVAPLEDTTPVDLSIATAMTDRLGEQGRMAVALVDSVPAGVYAKEALTSLGLWDGVADRLAQADNVRAALALVARAEAPLGIVYATDAHADPKVVTVATFPQGSHAPIIYPAALVRAPGGTPKPAARAFLEGLAGEKLGAAFSAEGFTLLADAAADAPSGSAPKP